MDNGRGDGDGRDPIGEICMLMCMETHSSLEYYESLPLWELAEKLSAYNSIMEKRIKALKNKQKK